MAERDEDAKKDLRNDTHIQERERTHTRDKKWRRLPKKNTGRRLNWCGHVMRRDEKHILRKVLGTDIQGNMKLKRRVPKINKNYWSARDDEMYRAAWCRN